MLVRGAALCAGPSTGLARSICSDAVLPRQAQVVICGAGMLATSVAYHLVKGGWTDVLVLEKDRIGSGTSLFGSGTLGLFKPIQDRQLITYSIKLYRKLQQMGYDIGFQQCGSLSLAQTKDRMIELRRRVAYHHATGLHCEVLGGEEVAKLHPYLRTDDLVGAVWLPEDAVATPVAICHALAKLSKEEGATFMEGCEVQQVLTDNGRVKAVTTSIGTVLCEYFINCAGMWARELGQRCTPCVRIPAVPAHHFYVTTPQLPQLQAGLPSVRDYDDHTYAREWQGGFMVGGFEPEARPAFTTGKVPHNWSQQLPQDWAQFLPLWEKALHRLPLLRDVATPTLRNHPDNFTPDGRWILGETPEVGNYFVAVGMNGNSLQGAGGIGRAVAEWVMEGEPTTELLPFSVQRFLDLHNNRRYLLQRVKEVVGRHYSIQYPLQSEYKYARKVRCSPLYSELERRGAVFGTRMGYERPLYFDSTYKPGAPLPEMPAGTFYKPKFFDFMMEEYLACREGVGIIDMSSFSKMEIKSSGTEVVDYLQRLCSNDVNIPVGGIVYTGMQNERGGYENDCMLVRQTDNRNGTLVALVSRVPAVTPETMVKEIKTKFAKLLSHLVAEHNEVNIYEEVVLDQLSFFMVSPTSQQTRIFQWLRQHLPPGQLVDITDVTSMYTLLNVVGPKSRQLMSELSNSDMNLLPFMYRKVNLGYASDVMVMSFTYTGEPGYCLYVPSEYALHVYDRLMTVGRDFGARDVGSLTQRFMRIQRFIPFWAEELTSVTTPYEAGHSHCVKLDKEYFVGKFALQRQKEQGVSKRLVFFHLEHMDPDQYVWLWGGEPIYRNNQCVGVVTSAGYGFALGKLVCMGFVERHRASGWRAGSSAPQQTVCEEYLLERGARYEVDVAGTKVCATPYLHAPLQATLSTHHHMYRPAVWIPAGSRT